MTVNIKKYFYNYNVRGDCYDKFNWGVLTVESEDCFDPIKYIKDEAKDKYPNHTSLNITALNLI
jgi:hypothetical protein